MKMEKQRKRRKNEEEYDSNTIFALLLSSLSHCHLHTPLIKTCLNQLRLSLRSTTQQILPNSILSLLPILLNSRCAGIVFRSAEIVGLMSLLSLEANEQVATDSQILKGLISLLGKSNKRVSLSAFNAVLDLSTTEIGRQGLLESSALERLMFVFLQVTKSSKTLISLCILDNGNVMGLRGDGIPISLLEAVMVLINSCNIEQLEMIPRKLSENVLIFLKMLWVEVHNKMLLGSSLKFIKEKEILLSNITISYLAESIFRLSINAVPTTTSLPVALVGRSLFGLGSSSFENFMLNHWELSPFRVRKSSRVLNDRDDIFSSFLQSLNSKGTIPSSLSSILGSMVSCFPISSDELDVVSFLKEVRDKLGCPIIYQQDIRVLRTERKREVHFFQASSDKEPHFLYSHDILKCEEAYKEGYSIALRGMEFRFESVAAIADGLAFLYGQPSVGANMYLTPPNSQGLALHYDDHCVFVCQLVGSKQWTIFPRPIVQLPRLYGPLADLRASEFKSSKAGSMQVLLEEGDVLYIPRGFAHEACTDDGGPNSSARFSLHLTLGIEVEPPFEWEGFAHVALYCWNQTQNQPQNASVESSNQSLIVMSVTLLHVVIGLIGDSDPTFRKACLVAATPCLLGNSGWLDLNQKTIFSRILKKISTSSNFLEALKSIEVAIQKKEDPLQRVRWLQMLEQEGKTVEGHNLSIPFINLENFIPLYFEDKDKVEAAFVQVKSEFCNEVLYEDVSNRYQKLLKKYKVARKQYMNGMLALHYNGR